MTPDSDKDFDQKIKTSDSSVSDKTTGDSEVQQGIGVEKNDVKDYEKSDDQQEYIEEANNNTALANEDPVQGDESLTSYYQTGSFNEDDDDDDDDERGIEVGDDPDETQKKIPVM